MASDPVLSVRFCVAYTMAATLRYARQEVMKAFSNLIDAEDILLASELTRRLILGIGNVDTDAVNPVIKRMLASEDPEVRQSGGSIAAFAALEWGQPDLMSKSLAGDFHVRKGVAQMIVQLIDHTSDSDLAITTLIQLFDDDADEVRQEAASVVLRLRGQPLKPFAQLVATLIASACFKHVATQLLLTLQRVPDKVDELILLTAQRFIDVFGDEATDIRSGAAADAHVISELVVRKLGQCHDRDRRAALLDVLDSLLELGVYGIDNAIVESERS
ncbi:hypothetical protein [Trueperella pyogenes]|uniref:hypothetical protein n=1 Tax=Trueperella pyogenes TaxID=1661 RepID=UPI00345DE238